MRAVVIGLVIIALCLIALWNAGLTYGLDNEAENGGIVWGSEEGPNLGIEFYPSFGLFGTAIDSSFTD